MKLLILFAMIFAHLVDDYYLQGILAKMKQKKWWEENAPDKMYRCDYIVALITHAFSWSFMITVPTLLISNKYFIMCVFIIIKRQMSVAEIPLAEARLHGQIGTPKRSFRVALI